MVKYSTTETVKKTIKGISIVIISKVGTEKTDFTNRFFMILIFIIYYTNLLFNWGILS